LFNITDLINAYSEIKIIENQYFKIKLRMKY